jgi:predicted ATPase
MKEELSAWLTNSFFLWHRRKSEYAGTLQKQDALDPDAVHLATRLDQLRTERPRMFHERLEAFINAVIPGLGEPTTRRLEGGKVEIMFGDCSLEALGGGVEQVLVLAVILLGERDEGGIFIEEPESHLHPDAQHRLIEQILAHRGNRQLFLTTHSPVFLNGFGDRADVFRVTRASTGKVEVERCVQRGHQRHVLDDLGVRPSSLLQSNCVVWVEGPTERVLVRHWLSLVDEALHEQRHYDFVYTGGSLLAHLGADVEAPSDADLQDLFRVCRHNYVICDRDAGPDATPAKRDVQRIQGMIDDHLKLWVTHAYEIEWYYPREIIAALWNAEVASTLSGDPVSLARPFYQVLEETGVYGTRSADQRKVEYARRAVKRTPRGSSLAATWFQSSIGQALLAEIERLATFIRRANGRPEAPTQAPAVSA